MDLSQILWVAFKLVCVALLVLANGFFVASEFALVSVRRPRIETLAGRGSRTAKATMRLLADPTVFISATQLGITLSSLALGWIGEATLADEVFLPLFEYVWPEAAVLSAHAAAIPVAFLVITYLHILFGELVPKAMSIERSERAALLLSRPLEIFLTSLRPFIWFLDISGSTVLKALGFKTSLEHTSVFNEEEIRQIVTISHQRGHLKSDEQILINNVFEFADTVASEVHVPRPEVVAVEIGTPLPDIVKAFQTSGFSRMPVYRGQFDEIVGILHSKDVMPYLLKPETFRIDRILHEPLFVPNSAPLEDVLRQMQKRKSHFSVLVDEHGGVEGIVTLEDLLERIVGDIRDEHDEAEAEEIRRAADGSWTVDGAASIKDVNRKLVVDLPESDVYVTLAGFLLERAGRLLEVGDTVEHDGVTMTVEAVERRRITRVRIDIESVEAEPVPDA